MCGRYRLTKTEALNEQLRRIFGISDEAIRTLRRYNVAPSQDCPVIIMDDEGDVLPIPQMMRWGFVPYWEKSDKPKVAPINAKSEQAATNGMFRQSVQKRRCLVPAILDDGEAVKWLAPGGITPQEVADLTAPHPADDMEATPISSLVNSPRNDLPEILTPAAFPPPPPALPKQMQGELF